TPNPLARAHSAQRPGVAVTRRLIASTNKMLHPNRPPSTPVVFRPRVLANSQYETGSLAPPGERVGVRGGQDPQRSRLMKTPHPLVPRDLSPSGARLRRVSHLE